MTRILESVGTRALLLFAVFSTLALSLKASSTDSLTFFNNWFVTGDYSVAGVGLRGTGQGGWATGKINMTGIPSGAQPIAAFLYWSTAEPSSTPSAAIGYFNSNKIQGAALGNPQSPNAGCGAQGATSGYAFVYRADVLRYLPVNSGNIPQAGGTQTVKLADSVSTANGSLYTNGASLVVIYKIVVPGLANIAPLRSVVIYNGAYTINKQSAGMTQNVAGFYQASTFAAARMSAIVANGQPGFTTPLTVNGSTLDTDPFIGAGGARWDNPSFNLNLAANSSSFSAMATANGQACVTWAALVASTNVQDSDNDGLLDIWEIHGLHRNTQVFPATFGTCVEYPSDCVNLPQMGALPNKKDVFIQIDWMHGTGDGTGGTDGRGTHDHIPQLAALSSVANVFASNGINLHYDVGPNYQGNQAACGNAPCPFIVPAAVASGGSDIDEATLVCRSTPTHACDYPNLLYPVLSFEFGFASVRDGNHLINIAPHFAQNRKDIFHYSLFAHALAGPFNSAGQPIDPFTGQPTTTPKSYSGIAHRPGGGFMVTLGLWRSDIPANDQVGSVQVQAGTLMHELGHNLGLGHAGLSTKPNCIPNYPSVMNYLYQTRGLTDASGAEHVDYSNGVLLPLSEDFLSTSIPMALFSSLQKYRVRYYGPLAPNQPSTQASQLHCDGSPISGSSPLEVRLEGPAVATPDWSNGTVALGKISPPLDVNYDGTTGQVFLDQPDWLTLNLQQIGTGYSFGGLSVGAFATDGGAYATDGGALATDAGALATDGGAFATDGGAFATDGGAFATDGGAFATDGGAFATDGGAFATDAGELDETTLLLSSVDPPATLTAANPVGTGITLTWTPPSVGQIQNYNIYRCAAIFPATTCTPIAPVFATAAGATGTPTFTDTVNDTVDSGKGGSAICSTKTCYNTTYFYFVTSVVSVAGKITESGNSNTVTTEVPHLFVIANAQPNAVYGAAFTNPPTFMIYGDVAGALPNTQVSCVYGATGSPVTPRNVGTYTIACSGPAMASVNNGVTYNAAYLTYTPGSFTITPRPITVTAANATKVYDGTVASSAPPVITGTLAYSDTSGFSETYDTRNAGTTHVMTASGVVNDTNGGLNYTVTFVKSPATAVISPLPITVTPSASTKVYDGTTSPQPGVIPTISPNLGAGDTPSFTEAYTSKNAGTGLTMTTSGSVNDGNNGNNYTITLGTAAVGTITAAPLTVTVTGSQTYGGMSPSFSISGYSGLVPTENSSLVTGTLACAPLAAATPIGTYPLTTCSGLSAPNYNINYTGSITVTKAPLIANVTGSQVYGGTNVNLVATYSGLVNGDQPGVVTGSLLCVLPATTSPVGTNYMATGCSGLGASNYSINYSYGNFVVTPAQLNVTISGTQTYGSGTPTYTISGYIGFVGTDNSSVVNGTVTSCTLTTPVTGPGAYSIASCSGLTAANYNITYAGTLTVSVAPLTSFSLLGATSILNNTSLQLTQDVGSETSAAWYPAELPVASGFTTSFQFQITGPPGQTLADGFAFVIQANPSGTSVLGTTGAGGYLGYFGIANSLAVEFDTYQNTEYLDPASPHIGIQSAGMGSNTPDHGTSANLAGPQVATFADGNVHTATITYNASTTTLTVSLDGNPVVSAVVNLATKLTLDGGTNAYVGFTAATGAAMEYSDILSWTWTPSAP